MINKHRLKLSTEKDVFSGFVLLLVFINMFIASFNIKHLVVSKIGSAFVPQIISLAMILFSLGIIIGGIKKQKSTQKVKQENKAEDEYDRVTVGVSIILIVLYAILLGILGFRISTILYLFPQMKLLAPKNEKGKLRQNILLLIISVVVSFAVYYIFRYGFELMLPGGIFE